MQLPQSKLAQSTAQQAPRPQHQRQLPPLHNVIKPDNNFDNEKQYRFEEDWESQTGFVDYRQTSATPLATPILQTTGSLMPALTLKCDDLSYRPYEDDMLTHSSGWGSASQYSNSATSYASSTSSPGYYNRPPVPQSRQQNLPSLSEIQLTQSTPAYRQPPMNRQPYFCTSPTEPLDITYTKAPNTFGPGIYNQTPRAQYTMPGSEYGSSMYDYQCYPNGTSWPPSMQCASGYVGSDTASIHSGRRRRGNLPKHVTDILRSWFQDHLEHPYPTEDDKQMLMHKTELTIQQISNWFINARRRHWPDWKRSAEQSRGTINRRS